MLSKAAGRPCQFPCVAVVHGKAYANSPARPYPTGTRFPSKEKISCLQKDPRAPSLVEQACYVTLPGQKPAGSSLLSLLQEGAVKFRLAFHLYVAFTFAYATFFLESDMETERRVRLFKNGRSQALRIPKDFELPGDEAIIRKIGAVLIVKPVKHPSLLALLATLDPLHEDFPDVDECLLQPDDIEL